MSNFYLLFGLDKSIIDNEFKNIVSELKISDVVKYNGNELNILDLIEDASTISMFSSKKLIVIEDCSFFKTNRNIDKIDELEKYFKHYNKNSYIIFICCSDKIDTRKKIYKLINTNGKVISCKRGDTNYLNSFVDSYLGKNNYKMEDVKYFLSAVGSNLDNIKNELDKLFMYKLKDKVITNKDVDNIVIKSMEDEIFVLTDAIIAKDVSKSLMLLEEFLNKSYDEIQIIMLLASQFRFLFQVKRLINKNKRYDEIAKILGVNPYRVKFTINKLYAYSEADLLNYIKELAKMDHDIKLGLIDKGLALELFIIK